MNNNLDYHEDIQAKREKFKKNEKRVLIKKDAKKSKDTIYGRIIGTKGKSYFVSANINNNQEIYECKKSGTMISSSYNLNILAVGDFVWFKPELSSRKNINTGTIIKVEERFSFLSRQSINSPNEQIIVSNADNLVIVMSVINPIYNRRLIDRYIIAAELGNLKPIICINKIDLFEDDELHYDFKVYQKLGINVFFVSALLGKGMDTFSESLKDTVSILSGPSGTGKSTVINNLLNKEVQSVNDISMKTFKGKHTTSNIQVFQLPNGGEIIDTPGIREFALWGLDKQEVSLYFHDFDPYYEKCKYLHCSHTHEPDCEVIKAVENNLIDHQRYESYLNIYDSID